MKHFKLQRNAKELCFIDKEKMIIKTDNKNLKLITTKNVDTVVVGVLCLVDFEKK